MTFSETVTLVRKILPEKFAQEIVSVQPIKNMDWNKLEQAYEYLQMLKMRNDKNRPPAPPIL